MPKEPEKLEVTLDDELAAAYIRAVNEGRHYDAELFVEARSLLIRIAALEKQ